MHQFRSDEASFDAGRLAIVELARQCRAEGKMTAQHVQRLTRSFLDSRSITREEADALFDIDAASYAKCAEWTECLVDAVTDHVVWQSRPTGILSSEQSEWLLAKFDKARTISSLAALVNILAEADRVPMWFLAAVRGRVARAWPDVEIAVAQAADLRAQAFAAA